MKPTILWSSETPSTGVLECPKKCSVRPAIKQVLIPSSSEVEKERWGPETVSKIKGWKMETLPPVNNTAFIMPVATPVSPSVSPTPATHQWLDKLPSANGIERSSERSDVNIGPAVEQALVPFSTKVGERRRVPSDTIINMQNETKGNAHETSQLAAAMLPAPASATPTIPLTHAVFPLQLSDGPLTPIEVASRRNNIHICVDAIISSSKIRERLWTAVSIQNEVEKNSYAPNLSTADTLQPSAPVLLPVLLAQAAISHLPSDKSHENIPAIEVVSS